MTARERLSEVILKLASIDPATRANAFHDLRTLAGAVTSESLTRISVALFYFYWYSETPQEEDSSRTQILGFIKEVPPELQLPFRCSFLESLVKLWDSVDKGRADRYLKLLKAFYGKVYSEFESEPQFKRPMVAWNDFLSTCIIFNPRCRITSAGSGPGAAVHAADHPRPTSGGVGRQTVPDVQAVLRRGVSSCWGSP